MNQHTTTPWMLDDPDARPLLVVGAGGEGVAVILGPEEDDQGIASRGTFDACLIVAAPNLLAACEMALPLLPGDSPAAEFVRRAIALAKGEEPQW